MGRHYLNLKEIPFLWHYCFGGGSDYILNESQWSDVQSIAGNMSPVAVTQGALFYNNGNSYYDHLCNFYSSEYAKAFGRATVTYDANGNPVGFRDRYDFHPSEDRTEEDENETFIGTYIPGTAYIIYYGVHRLNP